MNPYYEMPLDMPPYAMVSNPRNYLSEKINTDKYGFRKVLIQTIKEKNISTMRLIYLLEVQLFLVWVALMIPQQYLQTYQS